jgi:putative Holliday junction resolvase
LQTRLEVLVSEEQPIEVIIGLPIDLRGEAGIAAKNVQDQAQILASNNPNLTFRLVDERMTTRVARGQLRENGHTTRTDKNLIDAVAASVLLEDALAYERINGKAPGQVL